MAIQSFVMMYQAGEGWQYGKRKQSAMTNEEFNKQTPISIMENQAATLQAALPTIQKSLNAMTPLIHIIVEQYGDFAKEIIKVLPETIKSVTGGVTPEAIVQAGLTTTVQSPVLQTGSERDALAQFLKFLQNPVPSAGGESVHTTQTTTTADTEAQRLAKVNIRLQLELEQARLKQQIANANANVSSKVQNLPKTTSPHGQTTIGTTQVKFGNFQPTGGTGPTERQRIAKSIEAVKLMVAKAKTAVNAAIRSYGFGVSQKSPDLPILQQVIDLKKKQLQQVEDTLTLLKVKLARTYLRR